MARSILSRKTVFETPMKKASIRELFYEDKDELNEKNH